MDAFEMLKIKISGDGIGFKQGGFGKGDLRFDLGKLLLVLDTKLVDKAGRALVTAIRGRIQTIRHKFPFLR